MNSKYVSLALRMAFGFALAHAGDAGTAMAATNTCAALFKQPQFYGTNPGLATPEAPVRPAVQPVAESGRQEPEESVEELASGSDRDADLRRSRLKMLFDRIHADRADLAKIEEILKYDRYRDRLRQLNGRLETQSVINRRLRRIDLESFLRRGESKAAMNVIGAVYRKFEFQYAQMQVLDHQLIDLRHVLNLPGLSESERQRINAEIKKIEAERPLHDEKMGRAYNDYSDARSYLEEIVDTGDFVDMNRQMQNHGFSMALESVMMPPSPEVLEAMPELAALQPPRAPQPPVDPLKDPLGEKERKELYVETAKKVNERLGLNRLSTYFPEATYLHRRPSLKEMKDYVTSHPEAVLAMAKQEAREELFTLLKFAVNRSALILKSVAYKLPEEVKGVEIRRPITDAIGISYDLELIQSYSERVHEINRSEVSTKEKFMLLRDRAAGADQARFYEAFARTTHASEAFHELLEYAEAHSPDVAAKMKAGDEKRAKYGDLPTRGSFSPADRAFKIAVAIATAAFLMSQQDLAEETVDSLVVWIEGWVGTPAEGALPVKVQMQLSLGAEAAPESESP